MEALMLYWHVSFDFYWKKKLPLTPIQEEIANFSHLKAPPKTLADRIIHALDLYPCDLLFIHRDAEKEALQNRVQEIDTAIREINTSFDHVKIIPIRMTEAWLLTNKQAIRVASGNPNGQVKLNIPALEKLEEVPNPKKVLKELLLRASELKGRHKNRVSRRIPKMVHLVAENTGSIAPLRKLSAFRIFEKELEIALQTLGLR